VSWGSAGRPLLAQRTALSFRGGRGLGRLGDAQVPLARGVSANPCVGVLDVDAPPAVGLGALVPDQLSVLEGVLDGLGMHACVLGDLLGGQPGAVLVVAHLSRRLSARPAAVALGRWRW